MNNLKDELKNFPKIDLDSIQDRSVPVSEDIRNAVSLYNNAIDKIRSNNTDIAIIELKKAISIFPEFYDAILLLGVCVFYSGDRIEAINIFNSIRDDEERKRAIAYLEDLAERDAKKHRLKISSLEKKTQSSSGKNDVETDNRKTQTKGAAGTTRRFFIKKRKPNEIVSKIEPKGVFAYEKKSILDNPLIIKGMAYVAALLVIVCLFSWAVQSIRRLQMTDSPEFVELENKYKEEVEKANKYYKLYEDLKSKNSELYSKYILPIINQKYSERKINDLVALLHLLDIDGFTDPKERDRVSTITQEVLSEFSEVAYSNGQNYYNQNNFNRAIEEFESILKYNPEFQQIHWVLLNLGKSYRNIGEDNKAIETYDRLINEHGDTDAARQAVPLLNQLIEDAGLDRTPVTLPTPTPTVVSTTSTSGSTSSSPVATGSPSSSIIPSLSKSAGATKSPSPSKSPSPQKTSTPKPTPSPTKKPSPSPTPTPEPTKTAEPSPTIAPTYSTQPGTSFTPAG